MNITNKLRNIIIILLIFAILNLGLIYQKINEMIDDERIINISGMVRGGAQRLIKKELMGSSTNKEIIVEIEEKIQGLIHGSPTLKIPKPKDRTFINDMKVVEQSWIKLKSAIEIFKQDSQQKDILIEASENFWMAADKATLTSQKLAESQVKSLKLLQGLLFGVNLLILGVISFQSYQISLNILAREQAEKGKEISEARFRGIVDNAEDAIISIDQNHRIILFNQGAEKIFGYDVQEVLGKPMNILLAQHLAQVHTGHIEQFSHSEVQAQVMTKRPRVFGCRKDGSEFPAEVSIAKLKINDEVIYTAILRDVTERLRMQEKLEYDASHDSLTNLPNREIFMNCLERAISQTKRNKEYLFALLFLDLDDFKNINDSLGHLAGDELLVTFAHRLQILLRAGDTLARLGGDEFTILLEPIKDIEDALKVAERIHAQLLAPFILNNQEVFINTSIGITLSKDKYNKPEEILRDADTAMYRSKKLGKGGCMIFDEQMHHLAVNRLQLETELRKALERQEFRLYYQPIFSLTTNKILGFEALIRWQHPQKGFISPSKFIPLAEETGLIIPIGLWVLEEACRQLSIWHQKFPHQNSLTASVNISSRQIRDSTIIEEIDRIIRETNIPAQSLKQELTESILMENMTIATNFLKELRLRDIDVCLDDFGTGYSSLSYLHLFPVNVLKIDQSFVSQIQPNDEKIAIIRSIVNLAHDLDMDIIAEGIETKYQLEKLKELGCEKGQGYLFSKPLEAQALEALLIGN
ncbi:putative bifunctional diguanylate cyclase/phosphodiesterase [Dapis sp. BLCC M126]|uniref:putative bifunctional diguanylate cyclase/phosphodiesterase n=1 Tax=Dapis sp. BLCC M126 TaxID=3400189 RepID=UPI003CE80C5D